MQDARRAGGARVELQGVQHVVRVADVRAKALGEIGRGGPRIVDGRRQRRRDLADPVEVKLALSVMRMKRNGLEMFAEDVR